MTIAILGARGQLGHAFCRRLGDSARGFTRKEADLTRPADLERLLHQFRPQTVINCAAYNQVDHAEAHAAEAIEVNFVGVARLARLCAALDCLLVHFSTDYVFGRDQERRTPYREDDEAGPINIYGVSKLAGEFAVRTLCPRHLIVRSCGLYGPASGPDQRGNFVHTMLRLGSEKQAVQVVDDQVCCPTFAEDLVEGCLGLMSSGCHGVYHVTNAGSCSWHEFAKAVFACRGMTTRVVPVSSGELGRAARRPACSVLDGRRFQEAGLPPLRTWQEALQHYLRGLP